MYCFWILPRLLTPCPNDQRQLQYYGITGRTHHWISWWLTNQTQRVVISGTESDYVNFISGDPQGTVLGLLMFLLYINYINKNFLLSVRLFADDCVVYRSISNYDNTTVLLVISNWAHVWQNINKCVLLRVTRNHSLFASKYSLNVQMIQLSNTYKYLGSFT